MIKAAVQRFLNARGFDVVRYATNFSPQELETMRKVKGLTAAGPGRMIGQIDAVKYLVANKLEGAIVECGVWRGGSSMIAGFTLLDLGDTSRELYLFDTFEGMPPPTSKDVMFDGTAASQVLDTAERKEGLDNYWCIASVENVRKNIVSTGYPSEQIHLVKGKVEDTIPKQAPEKIALLRLDTDWYESTKHELVHLYPRLVSNGVLIIDDYGHWQGAKEAVDEYFAGQKFKPLLNRLDYTGRLIIKPAQ